MKMFLKRRMLTSYQNIVYIYDCAIDLQKGAQPPFDPIYNLLHNELLALKDCIAKNFIRHSKFLVGALMFFVKRKERSLQMCVDYHIFNKVTVNNRYFLLLIFGLFDKLGQAKIYTKIDLRRAYNVVCIKEVD